MSQQDFLDILQTISVKTVYKFREDASSDDGFIFNFGDEITNDDGSITLNRRGRFMVYCNWRITHNHKILTTRYDEEAFNNDLYLLEEKKILSIDLSDMLDISFKFEDDYTLDVFCDGGINTCEGEVCLWALDIVGEIYLITNLSNIIRHK